MYRNIIKRVLDFTFSLTALILLAPLILLIAILIKATSKGPVFFIQKRVGKNQDIFNIIKFRTMRIDTPKDCPTHLLKNSNNYITKIGCLLRKSSLDELPQLWNIICGEMSIVGPRPCLPNQFDLIELREEYCVFTLRPGLTGFAQINGRDELSIKEKAGYDKTYLKNISFINDLKIIILTISNVIQKKDIREGEK